MDPRGRSLDSSCLSVAPPLALGARRIRKGTSWAHSPPLPLVAHVSLPLLAHLLPSLGTRAQLLYVEDLIWCTYLRAREASGRYRIKQNLYCNGSYFDATCLLVDLSLAGQESVSRASFQRDRIASSFSGSRPHRIIAETGLCVLLNICREMKLQLCASRLPMISRDLPSTERCQQKPLRRALCQSLPYWLLFQSSDGRCAPGQASLSTAPVTR